MAGSGEAQQDITQAYVTELGRQPDAAGLVGNTLYLAGGGTLASLHAAFATGVETNNDIQNAYTASGHSPNFTQGLAIAAGQSELLSGIPFADLKAELGQLSGGPTPVDPAIVVVQITPAATQFSNNATGFAYGLLNNDALLSPQSTATVQDGFGGGTATIRGFNATTDILQFQSYQENGAGSITMAASASGTTLTPSGGGSVTLVGVSAASLHASNFQFVLPNAGVGHPPG